MTTPTNTIKTIVSGLKSAQLAWDKVTDAITFAVKNGESFDLLAVEIGNKIKVSREKYALAIEEGNTIKATYFDYQRPELACLVDACVAGGLEKASTKKFISEMIASAGFEAYSPALYTRHLGRHFAKAKTNDGSNAKKKTETKEKQAVSEVIIGLIPNIESAEGANQCLELIKAKLAELSK